MKPGNEKAKAPEKGLFSHRKKIIPLQDLTLIKLNFARFVGTGCFLIRYSNDHTNKQIAN
jgi:hypothetical protein